MYGDAAATKQANQYAVALYNEPVVTAGATYKFTGYVKGAGGTIEVYYSAASTVRSIFVASNAWVKVEFTFTGAYAAVIAFVAKSATVIDWKVDGCTVVQVS